MGSLWNRAQHSPLVRVGGRFLVVWLASALLPFAVIRALAWSGREITEGVEIVLLIQPAVAGILMALWCWSPDGASEDAVGKGMLAAVGVVWANVAALAVGRAVNPPPNALPLGVWGIVAPLLLFSVLALITGLIGGGIGTVLAKYLPRNRRQGHPDRAGSP